MAIAAIVMLGAVWTSLGWGLSVATAPVLFRLATADGDLQRADRLAPVVDRSEHALVRTSIEQLADHGHGTKPFTYVLVRLAQAFHQPPALKIPVDEETPVSAATPVAPAAHERARESVAAAFAADGALPPEIRFGTSRPALPARASAFADVQSSSVPTVPGVPLNLSVIVKSPSAIATERHVIVARAGDTLDSMLTALGVTVQDAGAIAALLTPHSWFSRDTFAGGEIVTVLQDPAQGTTRPWEVGLARNGYAESVVALSDNGAYVPATPRPDAAAVAPDASQDDVALRPSLDMSQSVMKLDEGLNRLAQDNRIAPSLIGDVMRLCAQDIDLEAAISARDTIEFLYSPNAQGEPELAYVALTLDGQSHRYYRFTAPDDGSTDYYDPDGYSVTASLMKQPVADGRLGDGFGWRIHPILRDRRFHEGVD
jgi:murein DD-endopeptidase MepM/ murein hydrolase activator NlpD